MIELLGQEEATPSSYPDAPAGLSTAAAALDNAMIWARIEHYIAHRWGEREVVWVVKGDGDWLPPLTPCTVDTSERWDGDAYQSTTLDSAPVGFMLEGETYRVTATVGSTATPPADVLEAYTRLAEYLAEDTRMGRQVNSMSVNLTGAARYEVSRPEHWHGSALQLSGAADLLRRYRRA